jgi:hypothetical protein
MSLPKKIKPTLPLTYSRTLYPRREELKDMISKDGTYLPKSILHADLDGGFLEFVKDNFNIVSEGKKIPIVEILITTQNWSQFIETWDFQNIDKNVEPPFITIVRNPEVKYGNNPSIIYNIPNRKMYYYMEVPTFDGNRKGKDIYKIPQPIPVDITYTVILVCNRMREVNALNQKVMETFSSRQAYQTIKGHYIPIINTSFSDESVMELEKRKYYIQKYDFTMMGFLLDEKDFEVTPAISRTLQMFEVDQSPSRRPKRKAEPQQPQTITLDYPVNILTNEYLFEYVCDLNLTETKNIDSYSVFINDDYYGDNINFIQINKFDTLKIDIIKNNETEESLISFTQKLF